MGQNRPITKGQSSSLVVLCRYRSGIFGQVSANFVALRNLSLRMENEVSCLSKGVYKHQYYTDGNHAG